MKSFRLSLLLEGGCIVQKTEQHLRTAGAGERAARESDDARVRSRATDARGNPVGVGLMSKPDPAGLRSGSHQPAERAVGALVNTRGIRPAGAVAHLSSAIFEPEVVGKCSRRLAGVARTHYFIDVDAPDL